MDGPARDILEVVYVGAGGSIMAKSFTCILESLARFKAAQPELLSRLHLRLYGTSAYWTPGEPKELEVLADRFGVGELVEEQPARISYLDAIRVILDADGLLILGVDDPAYMPSKLFTYALTGKPLLVSLHARSQANGYFSEMPTLGRLIHFDGSPNSTIETDTMVECFVDDLVHERHFEREREISPYLSSAAAQRHADFFERCLRLHAPESQPAGADGIPSSPQHEGRQVG